VIQSSVDPARTAARVGDVK
jgi:hypothetical protein